MLVLEKAVFKTKNLDTISRIPGLQSEIAFVLAWPHIGINSNVKLSLMLISKSCSICKGICAKLNVTCGWSTAILDTVLRLQLTR